MIINGSRSSFSGSLVINGVVAKPAGQATDGARAMPPASGLRIGGLAVGAVEGQAVGASSGHEGSALKTGSAQPTKETSVPQNVSRNFASTLMTRLEKERLANSASQKSSEDSQALLDSLTSTVTEIKDQFGQETANQVMAEILTNTETRVSSGRIAQAVTDSLQSLAGVATETLNRGTATADEIEAAQKTKDKLADFLEFLNQETVGQTDGGGEISGLSQAMNTYFGEPLLPKEEGNRFDSDFVWKTARAIAEKEAASGWANSLALSVEELGQMYVDDLVSFLRNDLGHEEAAAYIEGLGAKDDIFLAVDKVRDLLMENSHYVAGNVFDKTKPALPHMEGVGVEQTQKLNEFLHSNLLDAVNSAFRNDPGLTDRLQSYAATWVYRCKIEEVPAGIGLTTWPGGAFSLGRANNSDSRCIDLSVIGQTTAFERREQIMAQKGNFVRELAKTVDGEKRQQYEQFAQDCDQAFKEYLAGKTKTDVGSLVDQQV